MLNWMAPTAAKMSPPLRDGNPRCRRWPFTPANINEGVPADVLICGDEATVNADKACDSYARSQQLKAMGIRDGIMSKSNRWHRLKPWAVRLRYGHSFARAGEFAGGHQARGACADDDDVIWMRSGHAGASPTGCRLNIRVLDPVPQQHCAGFQSLAALQRHRRDGGSAIGLRIRGIEDARCTLRAVHG